MPRTLRVLFPLACALVLSAAAPARAVEMAAGPIWNNADAQNKCPNVCRQSGNARWNGQWRTLPGTATSVCDCDVSAGGRAPSGGTQWANAGPLWNQMDAQNKCPDVCRASGGRTWDGNWKTTEPGRMSVCSCQGTGQAAAPGAGAACRARDRGGCAGCSVQCAPGQRASCREGSTWNDRLGNGDQGCVSASQCTCT
ncbi:MAG: mannan-binding protein [Burkholderiales bacterium]